MSSPSSSAPLDLASLSLSLDKTIIDKSYNRIRDLTKQYPDLADYITNAIAEISINLQTQGLAEEIDLAHFIVASFLPRDISEIMCDIHNYSLAYVYDSSAKNIFNKANIDSNTPAITTMLDYIHRHHGNNPDMATTLGTLCFSGVGFKHDENAAKAFFQIAANAKYLQGIFSLGIYHKKMGEEDKALECFEQAKPYGPALFELGNYARNGDIEQAIIHYQNAITNGCLAALFPLVQLYTEDNQMDEAVEWINKAVELGYSKSDAEILLNSALKEVELLQNPPVFSSPRSNSSDYDSENEVDESTSRKKVLTAASEIDSDDDEIIADSKKTSLYAASSAPRKNVYSPGIESDSEDDFLSAAGSLADTLKAARAAVTEDRLRASTQSFRSPKAAANGGSGETTPKFHPQRPSDDRDFSTSFTGRKNATPKRGGK